jgi:hypothetical protein
MEQPAKRVCATTATQRPGSNLCGNMSKLKRENQQDQATVTHNSFTSQKQLSLNTTPAQLEHHAYAICLCSGRKEQHHY